MSLVEALKGARIELRSIHHPLDKARRVLEISKLFLLEMVGSALTIPYGTRALRTYFGLPAASSVIEAYARRAEAEEAGKSSGVAVLRGVRCGAAPSAAMENQTSGRHLCTFL